MIEPFFFGSGEERVFATYHPPADGSGRALTVICPPLFSDYTRTQLALRQLAIALAEQGQHVLRLDYRGTGDSYGELAQVSVTDWVADIVEAIQEGRDLAGSSVIRLLGVRLSGLLACKAARESGIIQRIVLWDPVSSGAGYVQLLRRLQTELLDRNLRLSRAERQEAALEYSGYALSRRMLEELHSLDARTYESVAKEALRVVSTSSELKFPVHGVYPDVTPYSCNWDKAIDDLLIPRPVLESLIKCLTQT